VNKIYIYKITPTAGVPEFQTGQAERRVQLFPLRRGTGYDEILPPDASAARWKTLSSLALVDPDQAPSETPAP